MKILFICNQGQNRSKTAEDMFKGKHDTDSAGIYSESNPLTQEKLNWADLIITMEESQREFIIQNHPKEFMMKKVLCLNIDDIYSCGSEKLKNLLMEKMGVR